MAVCFPTPHLYFRDPLTNWMAEVWVTHDRTAMIEWDFEEGKSINSWGIHKRDQETFVEHMDRAEWGTLYFSGPPVRHLTTLGGSGS